MIRAIFGVLFSLVGLVWLGQGVGLIPGSFMTGQTFWAIVGAILLVLGVALVGWGFRAHGKGRGDASGGG
jgi:hypothetical protein